MGFIYRKRINLGGGLGFNLSKSGISSSFRAKGGTIGSKGYSVRTGIPGFYYRGTYKKGGCASVLIILVLLGWLSCYLLVNSCSTNRRNEEKESYNSQSSIKIVYEKKFGLTDIFMCMIQDTSWDKIKQASEALLKNSEIGFVYCYDNRSKIRNINDYTNALDALPGEKVDYVCELIKRPGDPLEFNKVIENFKKVEMAGSIDKIKFILLDKKERNCGGRTSAKCRWYVFYIENFYDNKDVYDRIKQEAQKLPVDDPNINLPNSKKTGFTDVFFFNDKERAPKLELDGGWGMKESSNSMDKKYGKYLVGHVTMGDGEDFTFSKGF